MPEPRNGQKTFDFKPYIDYIAFQDLDHFMSMLEIADSLVVEHWACNRENLGSSPIHGWLPQDGLKSVVTRGLYDFVDAH